MKEQNKSDIVVYNDEELELKIFIKNRPNKAKTPRYVSLSTKKLK